MLFQLEEALPSRPAEPDFRHAVQPPLDELCHAVGASPLAHVEYTLVSGRADALFNRLLVEYKRPGVLTKPVDRATNEAIRQVDMYLGNVARDSRQKLERLAGVVFGDRYLIFRRFPNGKPVEEPPVEVSRTSLERFLTWLASLSSGVALTPESLNRDFAIEQRRAHNILRALFHALGPALSKQDTIVPSLFEQWRLFFSESIDYSQAVGGRKLDHLRKWALKAEIGCEIGTPWEAERFFAVHSYFALLLKLLAWLALSRLLGVRLGGVSLGQLVSVNGEAPRTQLLEMENGGSSASMASRTWWRTTSSLGPFTHETRS